MAEVERTWEHSIIALESKQALSVDDFLLLYDAYFPRVYNYFRYRSADKDMADDLTAQTFEQALVKLGTFSPQKGPFGAWLFAIARNTMNAHLRSACRRKWLSLEGVAHVAAISASSEDRVIAAQAVEGLLVAVQDLPERERDLLSLKFAGRLTNRRIAEISGLSESNVAVIIHRTVQKLRLQLRPVGDESFE